MTPPSSLPILAPRINANEEEVLLLEWLKLAGSQVGKGELLAILESSKASFEMASEGAGYLHPLVLPGQKVRVGQPIGLLLRDRGDPIPTFETLIAETNSQDLPARKWTKKAELVARRNGLEIEALATELSVERVITEKDVEAFLVESRQPRPILAFSDLVDDLFPTARAQRVLVLGGGVGAVQILDVLSRISGQRAVAILDDSPLLAGKTVMGCPVWGPISRLDGYWSQGKFDAAVLAINVLPRRVEIYEQFVAAGIPFANIVDPTTQVRSNVAIGKGNVIMGPSQLGACTKIGDNNFISAHVSLDHHNDLGSHCTFGPGVVTSGEVRIGDRVRFGTGIFVEPGLRIGSDCIVASGAILTADIPAGSVVKTRSNFVIQARESV